LAVQSCRVMKKLIAAFRLIFICIVISLYLIVVGIPILTFCRIKGDPHIALRLTKLLDHIILFLAGIRVELEGREKISETRGCVYVGNHRSFVDACAALLVLPGDLRFLAKKEIYKIPLVSFALRTMGIIEVDRSNPEASAKSIDRAVAEIQAGRSVVLFPEGTRSRSPHMLPFKKGAFVLAIKAKALVVPITLLGMAELLRPDTLFLFPGKVKIIIHDPIETASLELEDRTELLEKARAVIEQTWESEKDQFSSMR
jgi:1-acyl-sn-glycerol-3-phosphate acyltransferase